MESMESGAPNAKYICQEMFQRLKVWKIEIHTNIDITGRFEDSRGFPFNKAVMVEGRLRHRGDVVVPVSAANTICIFCIFCIFYLLYLYII